MTTGSGSGNISEKLRWQVLDFLVPFSSITILFAMIFKMLPEVEIAWSDVRMGAVLTSLLFTVGKFAIGSDISKSALASAYGATGSLVIVVAWDILFSFDPLFRRGVHSRLREQRWLTEKESSANLVRFSSGPSNPTWLPYVVRSFEPPK
jgi:membrane protein